MLEHVILDRLSEFLMVEHGAVQLYRTASARSPHPMLTSRYDDFAEDALRARQVLVEVITQLGGDPDHISPTARVAQFKTAKLLESALVVDGVSDDELAMSDLENVLMLETKNQADWELLRQLAEQASKTGLGAAAEKAGSMVGAGVTAATGGPTGQLDTDVLADALRAALDEVGDHADRHLAWAREKAVEMSLRLGMIGPAPGPERWQARLTNPHQPIEDDHVAPFTDGLLAGADGPHWIPGPISRATDRSR